MYNQWVRSIRLFFRNMVALGISLAIVELVLRCCFPQPSLFWMKTGPKKGERWNSTESHQRVYWSLDLVGSTQFDSQGFRVSHTQQLLKSDGKRPPQLVVLGGSISLGWPYDVSFVDYLSPYEVLNCSTYFSNLATYWSLSLPQCKGRIKDPDVVVIQVDLSATPGPTLFWPMALFYGESLIEDPLFFFNRNLPENVDKYSKEVKYRETGVPYLEYSDPEYARLLTYIEPPKYSYNFSHLFRFLYNRVILYQFSREAGSFYRLLPSLFIEARETPSFREGWVPAGRGAGCKPRPDLPAPQHLCWG